MHVLLLIMAPLLYLFHPYLAMGALILAVVTMYVDRTRLRKRRKSTVESESPYTAGYEN